MSTQITCPSCAMCASEGDHRQLIPVSSELDCDLRRCRNCGATIDISLPNPATLDDAI